MTKFLELADTDVLSLALRWCGGTSLAMVRSTSSCLAHSVPPSSPLWDALLRCFTAWLRKSDDVTTSMARAMRLEHANERCKMRLNPSSSLNFEAPSTKDHRHRIIITGARHSGITTLTRMITRGPPEKVGLPTGPSQDMCVLNFCAELGGTNIKISAVDKRSTVISTPLSASLYKGHTACLFLFDAGNMALTLTEVAWCIDEMQQAVGMERFLEMPKLLVCHKADLLLSMNSCANHVSFDIEAMLAAMPLMCQNMMQTYKLNLVFTTFNDQASVDLAFALAAEHWPKQEANNSNFGMPMVSVTGAATLRRATSLTTPARAPNLLDELHARVRRVE